MKPTFIGLGGQKCASSWLYVVFSDHPDAFVSSPKELNFFSAFYDRGAQWYESHFTDAVGRQAVGEISPSYLPDWNAAPRAYAYNADFRIVVALRDPVERAYSNHLHDIRLAYYRGGDLSFESGLANNPMYLEQSRYGQHLSRWLEYFPLDQILIVLQEDVQSDPQGQARRIYDFLGIRNDHVSGFVGQRTNESYLPRSRRREQFIRLAGAFTRRIGLGWVNRVLRRTGVISALRSGNRLDIRDIVPAMRAETRVALHEALGPDTLRLAAIMGRDSLPWKTWEFASRQRSHDRTRSP